MKIYKLSDKIDFNSIITSNLQINQMNIDLESLLQSYADKFTTNKATNKAYKNIFYLIYKLNVEEKKNNEYGFAEIDCRMFKRISWRKYKDILLDLYKNNLIYTNTNLNHSMTGFNFDSNTKITRGYKIDRDLLQNSFLIKSIQNFNLNSIKSIKSITFNSYHFYPIYGDIFLDNKGNYDIKKVYDYIDIDRSKIPYTEGSVEWNTLAQKWNKHTAVYQNKNRLYSWFHQIHGEEREFFTINGSHLREAFDVPACNFCILAKLLETTDCNKDELTKFQNIVKNEYIYAKIAEYLNLNIDDKVIKKTIKSSCQHWLNIRKNKRHTGSWKDEYFNGIDCFFKSELPSIYNILINWREEEHNGKTSKMLWFDFQKVEFEIISKKICNYLYKTYKVTPITVHDAIYLTDTDRRKISESIENVFWNELNLEYLNNKEEN